MKPTALAQSQTHQCTPDVKFGKGQPKPSSFAFSSNINNGVSANGGSVTGPLGNSLSVKVSGLQQAAGQAVSTISLTLDMASQKYGGVGQNGFNSNNVYDQITEVVNQVKDLVSDLQEASNGSKSCPAGGKLEDLNTEIENKQDKLSNDSMTMTPEIYDILIDIKDLLSLMSGRGTFNSQAHS